MGIAVIRRHPKGGYTWVHHEDAWNTSPPAADEAAPSYDTMHGATEAAIAVGGYAVTVPHFELWNDRYDKPNMPPIASRLVDAILGKNPQLRRQITPRRAALNEVADLIDGDRDSTYGSPTENFGRTAELWRVLFPEREWKPGDIARAMIAVKLARDVHASKRDGWLDIAGYAACGVEVEGL